MNTENRDQESGHMATGSGEEASETTKRTRDFNAAAQVQIDEERNQRGEGRISKKVELELVGLDGNAHSRSWGRFHALHVNKAGRKLRSTR
jgi:hypothetical protein